jgi:hypothetical protein
MTAMKVRRHDLVGNTLCSIRLTTSLSRGRAKVLAMCSAILVHPKLELRRFISSTSPMSSREGPFGPGFLRFREEYNKRYFLFTMA